MTVSMILLRLATIGWGVLCGGIVYEHLAIVPQWSKQPPASLSMWTGPFGVKAERFWMGIHPLVLLLLTGALVTGFGDAEQRLTLSIVIGAYVAALAATFVWFVPELLQLIRDPAAPIPPAEWRIRARRWEHMSLARAAVLIGLCWPLFGALAAR